MARCTRDGSGRQGRGWPGGVGAHRGTGRDQRGEAGQGELGSDGAGGGEGGAASRGEIIGGKK